MAKRILELLEPVKVSGSSGVETPGGSPDPRVPLHQVDELDDGLRLEVHVPIQAQQERVLCSHLLALSGQAGILHQLIAQEVVKVHQLGPS